MAKKTDQPKPAEGKPRAALATSRGGVTVIGPDRVTGDGDFKELLNAMDQEISAERGTLNSNEEPTHAD